MVLPVVAGFFSAVSLAIASLIASAIALVCLVWPLRMAGLLRLPPMLSLAAVGIVALPGLVVPLRLASPLPHRRSRPLRLRPRMLRHRLGRRMPLMLGRLLRVALRLLLRVLQGLLLSLPLRLLLRVLQGLLLSLPLRLLLRVLQGLLLSLPLRLLQGLLLRLSLSLLERLLLSLALRFLLGLKLLLLPAKRFQLLLLPIVAGPYRRCAGGRHRDYNRHAQPDLPMAGTHNGSAAYTRDHILTEPQLGPSRTPVSLVHGEGRGG